jgi:hypothetical protein
MDCIEIAGENINLQTQSLYLGLITELRRHLSRNLINRNGK